jgi:hypothetical protein
MTYTWEVTEIKTKDEVSEEGVAHNNAVVQTYWRKTGVTEDGKEGSFSGATPFTSTNVPEGAFTPFEDLTEDVVLGWIKGVVIHDYEAHVNSMILRQIEEQSITSADVPWALPVEEDDPTE